MKITGVTGLDTPRANLGEPSVERAALDRSAPAALAPEVALIELKHKLAMDALREQTTSNVSAAYHRMAMGIVASLKA